MKKTNFDKLKTRHEQMLNFQDKIEPFVPTIRELQEVWELASPSAARFVLQTLVDMGCVKTRTKGNITQYYAI